MPKFPTEDSLSEPDQIYNIGRIMFRSEVYTRQITLKVTGTDHTQITGQMRPDPHTGKIRPNPHMGGKDQTKSTHATDQIKSTHGTHQIRSRYRIDNIHT